MKRHVLEDLAHVFPDKTEPGWEIILSSLVEGKWLEAVRRFQNRLSRLRAQGVPFPCAGLSDMPWYRLDTQFGYAYRSPLQGYSIASLVLITVHRNESMPPTWWGGKGPILAIYQVFMSPPEQLEAELVLATLWKDTLP